MLPDSETHKWKLKKNKSVIAALKESLIWSDRTIYMTEGKTKDLIQLKYQLNIQLSYASYVKFQKQWDPEIW